MESTTSNLGLMMDTSSAEQLIPDYNAYSDTIDLRGVPPTRRAAEFLQRQAAEFVQGLDRSTIRSQHLVELFASRLLTARQQPLSYLNWMQIILQNEIQRFVIGKIPVEQRLLVIVNDTVDLNPTTATPRIPDWIGNLPQIAAELGYRVLIVEGSSFRLEYEQLRHARGLLCVAAWSHLESTWPSLQRLGLPVVAIPYIAGHWAEMSDFVAWVCEMMKLEKMIVTTAANTLPPPVAAAPTRTYEHLLRAASQLFELNQLRTLWPWPLPPLAIHQPSPAPDTLDPITGTEALSMDFLGRGGKHSRPFITLAVYDALTGGQATTAKGPEWIAQLNPAIKRVAMSIETFHKASLVHDDIEDDDQFRYGEPTLHRKYGTPTAINVGDYLIGLGYRLVSSQVQALGAPIVADILDRLAHAHLKLAEGQGAELLWRDSRNKQLTPQEALDIYALKTSPAFEAALYSGVRLTRTIDDLEIPIADFAKNLGIAFQILNDLGDWRGDNNNKLLAAGDVTGGRPTVLWALALQGLNDADREQLQKLAAGTITPAVIEQIRELYNRALVFEQADQLVEQHRLGAEAAIANLEPVALRELMQFLIISVLQKMSASLPAGMQTAR